LLADYLAICHESQGSADHSFKNHCVFLCSPDKEWQELTSFSMLDPRRDPWNRDNCSQTEWTEYPSHYPVRKYVLLKLNRTASPYRQVYRSVERDSALLKLVLLLHPFNGLSSSTTWVSQHQKGKPFRILLEQEMMGWQWHQLDRDMQIICTSLQTKSRITKRR